MKKPFVKICGNTNIDDARLSLEYGADMLGFIFYKKSPRYIEPERAGAMISELKKDFLFKAVGVFVNPDKEYVDYIISITGVDMLQFHGEETLSFVKKFNKEIIKAFRIKARPDILRAYEYDTVDYFLFDAFSKEYYGGTGKVFDWSLLDDFKFRDRLILSGGIAAGNVKEAVKKVKPYAVDLCSSIEKEPGIKDREKIKDFFLIFNNGKN